MEKEMMMEENPAALGEFMQMLVWALAAFLLVMKIIAGFRRAPPVTEEIDSKIAKCQVHNDDRFTGMNRKIDRLDRDLKERSQRGDEGRRRIHEELKRLSRESAGQESSIAMINQTMCRMEIKLDKVLVNKGKSE
jgi:hypothetical protein